MDGPASNIRPGGSTTSVLLWSTSDSPADISTGLSIEDMGSRQLGFQPMPRGTKFSVVTFRPKSVGSLHRTETIDYCVVISGRIELSLESGPPIKLAAGDVVVQRGTSHRWSNPGKTSASVAFVMVDAKPLGIGNPVTGFQGKPK